MMRSGSGAPRLFAVRVTGGQCIGWFPERRKTRVFKE